MTKLLRQAFLAALLFTSGNQIFAQQIGEVPSELELNRLGLTLAWWGQAVNDPGRDTIDHFTADEQNVYMQSTSGIVSTFNAESGRRLWATLVASPDQRGFAAQSNEQELLISAGMDVYSFDKMTGELLWRLRAPEHPAASPSVSERQLFVGSVEGSVYAFDLREVKQLYQENMLPKWGRQALEWRFKSPQQVVSPPVHSGQTVLFASQSGTVYGLSDVNKAMKFQVEMDAEIHTPLGTTRESVLVVDANSRLLCINKENGRMKWMFASGAPIHLPPYIVGNQAFVMPARKGMYSLSMLDGSVQWIAPKATQFVSASETRVYARDLSGRLLVLNREAGEMLGWLNLRNFDKFVSNERTDRIFVSNKSGLVLGIRELGAEFPTFHAYPERRPILPMLAPEEEASTEETQPTGETSASDL